MSKKLLLFGGLSVASIATITSTGIHFQKEAQKRKIEKARKEREIFINLSNDEVDLLNRENGTYGTKFLKYENNDDERKLMWIVDIWSYYKKEELWKTVKDSLEYTKQEMQEFEKIYWENQILKQQWKWEKQMPDQWLKQANSKSKYWEKFKEICLILMLNKKIDKDENMNTTTYVEKNLCVFSEYIHKPQLEKYKKENNSSLGVMEYFWKNLKNHNNTTTPVTVK